MEDLNALKCQRMKMKISMKILIPFVLNLFFFSFHRQRVQVEASKAQPKSPTTPEELPVTPPPRSPRVSGAGSPSASGNLQDMFLPVKVLTLQIILRQ